MGSIKLKKGQNPTAVSQKHQGLRIRPEQVRIPWDSSALPFHVLDEPNESAETSCTTKSCSSFASARQAMQPSTGKAAPMTVDVLDADADADADGDGIA